MVLEKNNQFKDQVMIAGFYIEGNTGPDIPLNIILAPNQCGFVVYNMEDLIAKLHQLEGELKKLEQPAIVERE